MFYVINSLGNAVVKVTNVLPRYSVNAAKCRVKQTPVC